MSDLREEHEKKKAAEKRAEKRNLLVQIGGIVLTVVVGIISKGKAPKKFF